MQNQTDLYEYRSYTAIDFVVGVLITVGASLFNALGLNVTKLDHAREEAKPKEAQRPDWKRGFWWLGLILYIASQVIGSTLALEFLRAEYVAPLGSASLIFNILFAYLLAGTPVTRTDILGTVVIVLGVVGVVVFGNHRQADEFDKEANISLSLLKEIWARNEWIAYYTCLQVTTVVFWWISVQVDAVCMARITDERGDAEREADLDAMLDGGGGRRGSVEGTGLVATGRRWKVKFDKSHGQLRRATRRALDRWSQSRPDDSIRKLAGLCWSVTGGLLAGQTLILAKSGVKLVTTAINKSDPNDAHQFASALPWVIIILLVVCAVAQVYCLNAALRSYDSTLCAPTFFGAYTISGFLNTLVYLDEMHTYQTWTFVCIWLSIAVLVAGVIMLSMKKPQGRPRASSLTRAEEGRDDVELAKVSTPGSEFPPTLLKDDKPIEGPRQGILGKLFGGQPADVAAGTGPAAPGEESRKDRRKGAQRLDDGPDGADSVLDSERGIGRGGPVELDEVDGLDFEEELGKKEGEVFSDDRAVDDDGDDFGDFKEGHEATGRRSR